MPAPPRGFLVRRGLPTVVIAAISYRLLTHRSDEPFLFGYSLFYLLCLGFFAVGLLFTFVLFRKFKSSAWYVLGAILIPVVACALFGELFAQVYAIRNPAYEVLYVQPDRSAGWKLVPNLRFTWAGPHWAAFEFSVPIAFNSAGFRDRERTIEKPPGVVRVALLGDSFVEALQVPFDKTAGQVLERSLNAADAAGTANAPRYEVLNFGVSAFGLGQYLLMWEQYARAYTPDVVFAYVSQIQMDRTVNRGGMVTQGLIDLWTRPTFTWRANELVLVPAGEFEKFGAAQQKLIRELGGERMRRRRPGLFLRFVLDEMNTRLTQVQKRIRGGARAAGISPETRDVNLHVLEVLNASVSKAGGHLVVVDAVEYHKGSAELSSAVRDFCAKAGAGYVNVSEDLLGKERDGIPTARAYDGHFNEVGNELLGAAMYRWMTSSEKMSTSQK